MQIGTNKIRTGIAVVMAATCLALAISTTGYANRSGAGKFYALAVSSGPGLELSVRGARESSRRVLGQHLVCETIVDVFVAKIGRRCAAERDHAAAADLSN